MIAAASLPHSIDAASLPHSLDATRPIHSIIALDCFSSQQSVRQRGDLHQRW